MKQSFNSLSIHKFDLLVSLYIACIVVSELMGAKTFPIINAFGLKLNASVAIFLMPLIFSINDVITEVYGKERTRSLIRSGLIMIAILIVLALFFTWLPPSTRFAATESAYDAIFQVSARISAASLAAFTIAEFLDVMIFTKIREKLGKSKLWLRNNLSNFISQFFDTTIFMVLAFYNFSLPVSNNFEFLISLILPYWLLKCTMSVIETPLVYLGVRWLKSEKAG